MMDGTVALWTLAIAAVGVVVSATSALLTYLLWRTSIRTIELNSRTLYELNRQVSHQIALGNTLADQNITDGHRDLFLAILQDPELLKVFSKNENTPESVTRENYLATALINHCSTIFNYLRSGILSPIHLESYAKDTKYLFDMPFISKRWEAVRIYHSTEFGDFVSKLLEADEARVAEVVGGLSSELSSGPTKRI
jgi:hypothetical protein